MSQEERPFDRWQARALCQMMRDFYAQPENRAAFEVWQGEPEKRKARRCWNTDEPDNDRGQNLSGGVYHNESKNTSIGRIIRRIAMKMKIQALYLTGTALLIGAAGVGDSVTFDTVGSWTGAAILAVLLAAGGIVCWGYGRGLEIERAEKAQMRRYCRKLKSCQRAAEEKNDRHSA